MQLRASAPAPAVVRDTRPHEQSRPSAGLHCSLHSVCALVHPSTQESPSSPQASAHVYASRSQPALHARAARQVSSWGPRSSSPVVWSPPVVMSSPPFDPSSPPLDASSPPLDASSPPLDDESSPSPDGASSIARVGTVSGVYE